MRPCEAALFNEYNGIKGASSARVLAVGADSKLQEREIVAKEKHIITIEIFIIGLFVLFFMFCFLTSIEMKQ